MKRNEQCILQLLYTPSMLHLIAGGVGHCVYMRTIMSTCMSKCACAVVRHTCIHTCTCTCAHSAYTHTLTHAHNTMHTTYPLHSIHTTTYIPSLSPILNRKIKEIDLPSFSPLKAPAPAAELSSSERLTWASANCLVGLALMLVGLALTLGYTTISCSVFFSPPVLDKHVS